MDLREAFIRLSNIHTALEDILIPERLTELDSFIFDLGKAADKADEKAKVPAPDFIGEPKSSPAIVTMAAPLSALISSDWLSEWTAETADGGKFGLTAVGAGHHMSRGRKVIAHKLADGRWVTHCS